MPVDPSGMAGRADSCQSCGTVTRPGACFCRKCGASMTGRPATDPSSASGTNSLGGVGGTTTCCPNCFAPACIGARFCAKCGSNLLDQEHDRTRNDEAVAPGVMEECPGCGARVTAASVVCSACGLTLDLVEDNDGKVFPPPLNEEEDAPEEEPPGATSPPSISPDSLDGRCIACGAPLDDDACSCQSCGISYGSRSNELDGAGLEQEAVLPWHTNPAGPHKRS